MKYLLSFSLLLLGGAVASVLMLLAAMAENRGDNAVVIVGAACAVALSCTGAHSVLRGDHQRKE